MKIAKIGIDLAKEVFQIHGVDKHGKNGVAQATASEQDDKVLRQYRDNGATSCVNTCSN